MKVPTQPAPKMVKDPTPTPTPATVIKPKNIIPTTKPEEPKETAGDGKTGRKLPTRPAPTLDVNVTPVTTIPTQPSSPKSSPIVSNPSEKTIVSPKPKPQIAKK